MRCASVITYYPFTTATGNTRVAVTGLQLTADVASCPTSQLVVMTEAEFSNYFQSPFNLAAADAAAIGGAVMLLWSVGYGFRVLIRFLRGSNADTVATAD